MKSVLLTLIFVVSSAAFAADKCRSAALSAAEDDYSSNPHQTIVKTVKEGSVYHVAVGIGNPEDGRHDYEVVFPNGCDSQPKLRELERGEKF